MSTKTVVKSIGQVLSKNSPTILTGFGVAGLVSTALLAVKATPKAMQLLEYERELRIDQSKDGTVEDFTKQETVMLVWKCYVPTVIMGALTIGCIIGANSINLRRNAALASVYSLSETALKEYRAKVVETIGKNKEREIRDEVAKDKITNSPVSDKGIILTGKGETLCYEALSGRYFKSDIEQIRRALNDVGRDMLNQMTVSLNDVYYALGLQGTRVGDLVGWCIDDGIIEPDFTSQLTEDGTPCLVLDFMEQPRYIYHD